jgi:hypothetical protein
MAIETTASLKRMLNNRKDAFIVSLKKAKMPFSSAIGAAKTLTIKGGILPEKTIFALLKNTLYAIERPGSFFHYPIDSLFDL